MAITKVQIRGVDGLIKTLNRVEDSISPTAIGQSLDAAASVLVGRIRQRFLQERDVQGNSWTKSEAARREGRRTLLKTGRLFRSIQAFKVDSNTRAVGTDVPYAKFHQFGTRYLPKRSFIGANSSDIEAITDVFLKRLRSAIRG